MPRPAESWGALRQESRFTTTNRGGLSNLVLSGGSRVPDANGVQPFKGDRRLSLKTARDLDLEGTCRSGTAAFLRGKHFFVFFGQPRLSALHRTHPLEPVPSLRQSIS